MPNAASAIVTAAEPIRATFPARASIGGCRAADRTAPPVAILETGAVIDPAVDRTASRPVFTRRRARAVASGTTFAAPGEGARSRALP
jgi:hypothetical protein